MRHSKLGASSRCFSAPFRLEDPVLQRPAETTSSLAEVWAISSAITANLDFALAVVVIAPEKGAGYDMAGRQ